MTVLKCQHQFFVSLFFTFSTLHLALQVKLLVLQTPLLLWKQVQMCHVFAFIKEYFMTTEVSSSRIVSFGKWNLIPIAGFPVIEFTFMDSSMAKALCRPQYRTMIHHCYPLLATWTKSSYLQSYLLEYCNELVIVIVSFKWVIFW